MFITHPHFEFPIPAALGESSAQHWRLVEFDVHLAWFILSVERQDPATNVGYVRTYFFAWETDLARYLATVNAKDVVGLVCMEPAWSSATGGWTSHAVQEVWWIENEDGQAVVELIGAAGEKLDVGLPAEAATPLTKRTLLLTIQPRKA